MMTVVQPGTTRCGQRPFIFFHSPFSSTHAVINMSKNNVCDPFDEVGGWNEELEHTLKRECGVPAEVHLGSLPSLRRAKKADALQRKIVNVLGASVDAEEAMERAQLLLQCEL